MNHKLKNLLKEEGLFILVCVITVIFNFRISLLPISIFFMSRIAIKKKNNLWKIAISLILPAIFFLSFLGWTDMRFSWFLIPVLATALFYFIFFKLSEIIVNSSIIKNPFLEAIIISLIWIFCLESTSFVFETEFYWMYFSFRWFGSYLSKLNLCIYEFILFFIISYFSLSLKNRKKHESKKHLILSLILLVFYFSTFFIPNNIEHKQNILAINLDLDFSYTYREENLNEIIDKYVEAIVGNNTQEYDLIILPEYVITKDWRYEKEIIEKFRNASKRINTPILVGSLEYENLTHFYNVAVYISENETKSFKDVYPMPLSNQILRGEEISLIQINNQTFAILLCFSSTQSKYLEQIKNNEEIEGLIILSNEQALYSNSIKREAYFLIRFYENYIGKPIYKVANQGINYPN